MLRRGFRLNKVVVDGIASIWDQSVSSGGGLWRQGAFRISSCHD
jgi:hypothetical protein